MRPAALTLISMALVSGCGQGEGDPAASPPAVSTIRDVAADGSPEAVRYRTIVAAHVDGALAASSRGDDRRLAFELGVIEPAFRLLDDGRQVDVPLAGASGLDRSDSRARLLRLRNGLDGLRANADVQLAEAARLAALAGELLGDEQVEAARGALEGVELVWQSVEPELVGRPSDDIVSMIVAARTAIEARPMVALQALARLADALATAIEVAP